LVAAAKFLVAAAKFLVAATKKIFVGPNFIAVTKPFFSVYHKNNIFLKTLNASLKYLTGVTGVQTTI